MCNGGRGLYVGPLNELKIEMIIHIHNLQSNVRQRASKDGELILLDSPFALRGNGPLGVVYWSCIVPTYEARKVHRWSASLRPCSG